MVRHLNEYLQYLLMFRLYLHDTNYFFHLHSLSEILIWLIDDNTCFCNNSFYQKNIDDDNPAFSRLFYLYPNLSSYILGTIQYLFDDS